MRADKNIYDDGYKQGYKHGDSEARNELMDIVDDLRKQVRHLELSKLTAKQKIKTKDAEIKMLKSG